LSDPELFPLLRSLVDEERRPERFVILGLASPALLRQIKLQQFCQIARTYRHYYQDVHQLSDQCFLGFPAAAVARERKKTPGQVSQNLSTRLGYVALSIRYQVLRCPARKFLGRICPLGCTAVIYSCILSNYCLDYPTGLAFLASSILVFILNLNPHHHEFHR
jgi:hypothetical protein